MFQLAGEQAWYAGQAELITRDEVDRGWHSGARREARAHVERILNRLPARERDLLTAMSRLDPEDRTATRITKELGLGKATEIGPIAQRLDTVRGIIERGKPYSFRHRAVEALLSSEWPDA